jgi:hypothetical protein
MGRFTLLSSYKIFRYAVNNTNVHNSACNVPGRFVGFSTNLGFLQNKVPGKIRPVRAQSIHTDGRKDGPTDKRLIGVTFELMRRPLKT